MSVRYFYLINLVITTAFLEQGSLDPDNEEEALLLAAMALGRHDTHLQEGAINRPYYATL